MEPRRTPAPLAIQVEATAPNEVRVVVSGEIDLASSAAFEERVEPHLIARNTVILDLSGVSFVDSTGLQALWSIRQRSVAVEGRLMLASPSDAVSRLLRLTRLDKVFEHADAT